MRVVRVVIASCLLGFHVLSTGWAAAGGREWLEEARGLANRKLPEICPKKLREKIMQTSPLDAREAAEACLSLPEQDSARDTILPHLLQLGILTDTDGAKWCLTKLEKHKFQPEMVRRAALLLIRSGQWDLLFSNDLSPYDKAVWIAWGEHFSAQPGLAYAELRKRSYPSYIWGSLFYGAAKKEWMDNPDGVWADILRFRKNLDMESVWEGIFQPWIQGDPVKALAWMQKHEVERVYGANWFHRFANIASTTTNLRSGFDAIKLLPEDEMKQILMDKLVSSDANRGELEKFRALMNETEAKLAAPAIKRVEAEDTAKIRERKGYLRGFTPLPAEDSRLAYLSLRIESLGFENTLDWIGRLWYPENPHLVYHLFTAWIAKDRTAAESALRKLSGTKELMGKEAWETFLEGEEGKKR
jgi:hypothetical protein